jgi:hypothetical protein
MWRYGHINQHFQEERKKHRHSPAGIVTPPRPFYPKNHRSDSGGKHDSWHARPRLGFGVGGIGWVRDAVPWSSGSSSTGKTAPARLGRGKMDSKASANDAGSRPPYNPTPVFR